MKKVVLIILILMIVSTCFFPTAVAVEEGSAYQIMEEFVTLYPHRESGTEGESEAGEYIQTFFESLNLFVSVQEFEYEVSNGYYVAPEIMKDKNILARIDTDSKMSVVIGAHYDNAFTSGKGQGAYDNGSGIGIMLALCESLKDENLDYDLEFVAFGGEEKGLIGSQYYLEKLSATDKNNIVLYVNLDSVLAGDTVYMYCDEVPTLHQDYFVEIANKIGAKIETYPTLKDVAGIYSEEDKLPYTHPALLSDNATFFNAGITSVSFSSYSLQKDELEQVNESTVYDNIMHTENDNLEQIEKLYGESAKQKMQDVYNLLHASLTETDFIEEMTYAKLNNPNYDKVVNGQLGAVVSAIVLGVLIVVMIIICDVYNKKARKEILEKLKNSQKPEVFGDF